MGIQVPLSVSEPRHGARRGVRIEAAHLSRHVGGGHEVLHEVSLVIEPGELVGVVGGSGAGKTTLLEALAGVVPADSGRVTYDGVDLYRNPATFRGLLGYVPQDDIIHTELPLARTLRYAARLRLPDATAGAALDTAVAESLRTLGLESRAHTRVSALSGGQRKRASIAVELLTRPAAFFLDEPTSGLDPVTSAELVGTLRHLADEEATVVFTTHSVQDLVGCDRVAFLAPGGRLAFLGTLPQACRHFGVSAVEEIYAKLSEPTTAPAAPPPAPAPGQGVAVSTPGQPMAARARPGRLKQWWVLTARAFETMARNRLTVAILLGSPLMVVGMFALLFQRGAFDAASPDPTSILMILFWVVFGAFFFGLTYGLLQICTEWAIVRREHTVGLRLSSYLLSKVAVLLPFLLAINIVMILVLRALDRLPRAEMATYGSVTVTLTLVAAAALTLGLLASAAVANPAQATLVLPMLCFPAVLFSGAILPVHVMATAGAWFSTIIPVRWGFEAVGHDLAIRELLLAGGSPLGPPLVESYGSAGLASTGTYWTYLGIFIVVLYAGAWTVLARRVRRSHR